MANAIQIAINLISALIGALVNEGWRRSCRGIRQRHLRQFWSFTNRRVAIVFPMYGDPRHGSDAPKIMAHVEDVLAIAKITRLLTELKQEYRLIDDGRKLEDDEDLILVCSPLGNKQSKTYAGRVQLPFVYDESRPCFRDPETGAEHTSAMDRSDGCDADTALVAKLVETNPPRTVFLFWGLHGPGTLGSVHFAVDHRNMKEIDRAQRRDGVAFILHVPFHRAGGDDRSGPREPGHCTIDVAPRLFDPRNMKWIRR